MPPGRANNGGRLGLSGERLGGGGRRPQVVMGAEALSQAAFGQAVGALGRRVTGKACQGEAGSQPSKILSLPFGGRAGQ